MSILKCKLYFVKSCYGEKDAKVNSDNTLYWLKPFHENMIFFYDLFVNIWNGRNAVIQNNFITVYALNL